MVGRPFPKGVSGNPGGRPKEIAEIRDLAREHTEKAVKCLVGIIESKKATDAAKVAASEAILSRGWGKPAQYVFNDGPPAPENPAIRDEKISAIRAKARGVDAPAGEDATGRVH